MQLLLHNFSRCQTGPAGHTRNPHNPTKTTMMNLSSSGSRTEFGDRITRQPIPLDVHPFQILWNLIDRLVGVFPGLSQILPNLTIAFPYKNYTGKTRQVRLHSYYTQSFNQPLVTYPKIRIPSRSRCSSKLFPFNTNPSLTVLSCSNLLHKASKLGHNNCS